MNLKHKIKSFLSWSKVAKNIFSNAPPIYTESKKEGIRIHIGPGDVNLQGWLNIDARNFSHTHLVTDKLDLNDFKDNSIQAIYLCHVLEHFSFDEVEKLLKVFYKKLKINGELIISVPNYKSLTDIYIHSNYDLTKIKNALMGGQDYEYNFHKAVFDKKILEQDLISAGFSRVDEWSTKEEFGKSIGDWSDYFEKINGKKIQLSLNLKGTKNK